MKLSSILRGNFLLLILILFLIEKPIVHSQERATLKYAESYFKLNHYIPDSIIKELIAQSENKLTNDSIKVEVIYLFRAYACDTCLAFLINHIASRYSYGSGIHEIDQSNERASYSQLSGIAYDRERRWRLLPLILNSLKKYKKSELEIHRIFNILCYISDEKIAKSIIEFELNENLIKVRNHIYEENLTLILKKFE